MSEEFTFSAMHRLLKKAGAERVGEDAATELSRVLDEIGLRICRQAVELASHAGRKTVKASDIQIAAKPYLE
ncbi:MAG: NFYB/HAP3 family transcription factor subunit [Thermoproteota archaeon]|jgi:histone H3/H4|nr:NFYB/HAP3 family transcription factor subunit [Candidatus Brockarchaeota archaeon]MCI4438328.1 NFYB/HAP3 family transcription factor subunit [archaeon]NHV06487.1 histone [Nitrososphaerota archaeon]MBO3762648.1 NFYB/HAP3 family transcription factor subunit [Candidatus Brockarchaeota archaeon]MBO3768507.1 NFYB/HAP3 family transcription factor subunit [Candidatus Brockarchaeota archaeon]